MPLDADYEATEIDVHLTDGGKNARLNVLLKNDTAISVMLTRESLGRLQNRIAQKLSD